MDKRKIALTFMKEVCGSEELTVQSWALLKNLESRELAKALVLKWRKEGLTLGQLSIRSGLSQRQVKHIIKGIPKGT